MSAVGTRLLVLLLAGCTGTALLGAPGSEHTARGAAAGRHGQAADRARCAAGDEHCAARAASGWRPGGRTDARRWPHSIGVVSSCAKRCCVRFFNPSLPRRPPPRTRLARQRVARHVAVQHARGRGAGSQPEGAGGSLRECQNAAAHPRPPGEAALARGGWGPRQSQRAASGVRRGGGAAEPRDLPGAGATPSRMRHAPLRHRRPATSNCPPASRCSSGPET